jgi:predicted Holliday junction resolvase-like endonuclease
VGSTFEEQSSKEVTVAKSDEQVMEEFHEPVNMRAKELEEWLQTEESREVGQKDGGSESRGHESGRRIVEILEKDRDDYTEDDVSHMRDVVSYVHRHQAQRPEGDVEDTNWRYSLINWGHDPLK